MHNVYEPKRVKITKVIKENAITNTLFLKFDNQKEFKFLAGQFMMIGLPGFGECPISISSNPKLADKYFTLTVRIAGELTGKLNSLKTGAKVFVRGPFGNGFPEVDRNLILIGGGCGFIPLMSVCEENRARKDIKMQMFFGCANKQSLVFQREFQKIKSKHDFNIILEKETLDGFSVETGFVTELIKKNELLANAKVFVCGPDLMYKFVVKELLNKGIKPTDIYLSLERRMHCGVGVCQHCAIGTKYICKDGPVFSYDFLKNVPQYKF
jgi:NAD(P)H-flavin reductase